jgi:hypothetical protein
MTSYREIEEKVNDVRRTLYGNGKQGVCDRLTTIEVNLKWQLKGTGVVIGLLITMLLTYIFKSLGGL